MSKKIIPNILGLAVLLIFQIAVLPGLPAAGGNLNAVIIALVFILGLYNFKTAIIWSLICGLVLDIYSFSFFGIYLITLPLMVLLTNFLLNNFFTNRSLYSFLALTIFAYLFFRFCVYGGNFLITFFQGQTDSFSIGLNFWLYELKGLLTNMAAVVFVFYVLNFFSKKFRPATLGNNR